MHYSVNNRLMHANELTNLVEEYLADKGKSLATQNILHIYLILNLEENRIIMMEN